MPKHVVVIGAGMAGLAATAELLKAGCQVTVLEAKVRLGGRIHTVMHESTPVELGAEFLHGQNQSMVDALRLARLPTLKMNEQCRILHPNGKFKKVDLWGRIESVIDKIDFRKPDCSFSQFIQTHRFSGETRQMSVAFVEGFNAARASQISAHSLLHAQSAEEHMAEPAQSRITKGYGALVKFYENLIDGMGGSAVRGMAVRQVSWRRQNVTVYAQGTQTRGQKSVASNYRAYFDAAVITLPLGVLKAGAVKFSPSLVKKTEAIAQLQFGNALRVSLVFKERWWREKDFGSVQASDEAIPVWWSDPRGPVLTGWAGGPKADALLAHSSREHGKKSIAIVSRIFSRPPSFLRQQLVIVRTHNWARDPHIRGAYSYVPVNGLHLPKTLAAPVEGTLFFAGEATALDAQSGTVTGALESGLRAARQILEG